MVYTETAAGIWFINNLKQEVEVCIFFLHSRDEG